MVSVQDFDWSIFEKYRDEQQQRNQQGKLLLEHGSNNNDHSNGNNGGNNSGNWAIERRGRFPGQGRNGMEIVSANVTADNSQCQECGSVDLREHTSEGNIICMDCGSVVVGSIISLEAEWRYYGAEDSKSVDPTRCGPPTDDLLPKSSMGTGVSAGRWYDNSAKGVEARMFGRMQNWLLDSKEQSLRKVFDRIEKNAQLFGIPKKIINESFAIFKELTTIDYACGKPIHKNGLCESHYRKELDVTRKLEKAKRCQDSASINRYQSILAKLHSYDVEDTCSAMGANLSRGKPRDGLIASCLYVSCKRSPEGSRSLEEIARIFGINKHDMSRGYNRFQSLMKHKESLTNLMPIRSMDLIPRYCNTLNLPYQVQTTAARVSELAQDTMCDDSTPKSLAAGSIYMVVDRLKINKSLTDISKACDGVSAVTIQKIHKKMMSRMDLLGPLFDPNYEAKMKQEKMERARQEEEQRDRAISAVQTLIEQCRVAKQMAQEYIAKENYKGAVASFIKNIRQHKMAATSNEIKVVCNILVDALVKGEHERLEQIIEEFEITSDASS